MQSGLSFQTRKAMSVQLGEKAAAEIVEVIQRMSAQIEELKRSKVNVTRVVPAAQEPKEQFSSSDQW